MRPSLSRLRLRSANLLRMGLVPIPNIAEIARTEISPPKRYLKDIFFWAISIIIIGLSQLCYSPIVAHATSTCAPRHGTLGATSLSNSGYSRSGYSRPLKHRERTNESFKGP